MVMTDPRFSPLADAETQAIVSRFLDLLIAQADAAGIVPGQLVIGAICAKSADGAVVLADTLICGLQDAALTETICDLLMETARDDDIQPTELPRLS